MPLLITGFTAFGAFEKNPSEEVARQAAAALGASFAPIEVSFAAAENFIDSLLPHPPTALIMLGVAGRASKIRLESIARNHIGPTPDVRNITRGPNPISATHPPALPSNLFTTHSVTSPLVEPSQDAGDYLCNFIYFTALSRLTIPVGFIHIPPATQIPIPEQVPIVLAIIRDYLKT